MKYIILFFLLPVSVVAQYGFRTEIPYNELSLDTPLVDETVEDFFEIYTGVKANSDTIVQCSVNKDGNEILRIAKRRGRNSVIQKSKRSYDEKGRLLSRVDYGTPNTISKLLVSYNKNDKKEMIEEFSYLPIKKLKSPELKQQNNSQFFSISDEVDSNYIFSNEWVQKHVWFFKYDKNGNLTEYYFGDSFNQSIREVSNYNREGKISGKITYSGSCCNSAGRDPDEIIDTTNSYSEEITMRDTLIYFNNGYLVDHIMYNPFNEIKISRDSIITDSKNRIVAEFWSNSMSGQEFPAGAKLNYERGKQIEYDNYGRKLREINFDHEKKTESKYLYKHPSKIDLVRDRF
ncbi:MAG: hypothetical protein IPP27_04580 [Bacteroidetes bacterium]|nr:hypothetical protein [Bacteroidota bacterium]MBK9415043.1 hypothetical protein [Bacteroidota bacterium]MBL0031474.1 hypothetical protein [Bacteroidota bacterium]MBP6427894.1 hypothetical protein [Bacteroidia bacterium]